MKDELGALSVGLLAGAGIAAGVYYVTRLLLARAPLSRGGPVVEHDGHGGVPGTEG